MNWRHFHFPEKEKKSNYYLTVYTQTDVGIKQKGRNINARKQLFFVKYAFEFKALGTLKSSSITVMQDV